MANSLTLDLVRVLLNRAKLDAGSPQLSGGLRFRCPVSTLDATHKMFSVSFQDRQAAGWSPRIQIDLRDVVGKCRGVGRIQVGEHNDGEFGIDVA